MDLRLPKLLSAEGKEELVRNFLVARPTMNIGKGEMPLIQIEADERFISALEREFMRRRAIYGLEAIKERLEKEERGLKERGTRVSRLLITSRDGSPRFYREVAHLLNRYTPRLMGLIIDLDSRALSAICGRKERGTVKAVMVNHKAGVAEILGALI
ncbi:MAG TPA: hypothetical protein PLG80_06580 [Syntrophales bacterium]|nr:hypothetical protein [Syntrophales bacterium]